ncbi:MAG TPA: CCA tRNA nucleotidyltransferase [bacterium]|nr:CCA tRNA nucleotidyltransferase [bacterium]
MSTRREGALLVVRRLRDRGFQAYWVGGCVRDLEMGQEPHDYDIATGARPEQVAGLFEHAVLVGAQFGVVIVSADGHSYEVATFRAEGPYLDGRRPSSVDFVSAEEDVARRDFTINGLLHDPLTGTTLDYVGGREDIARRIVRTIGDPEERFAEDRLRMLRAVRLAAQLDFELDPDTMVAIQRQAPALARVSAERIRDELLRLLTSPGRARGLGLLDTSGLLEVVLPEVAAMHGVEQPPEFHPEGDVFTHTVLALEHLRDPSPELAMATLLHDVGKPPTFERAPDRIRFNGHAEVGARLAAAIGRRLRLSGDQMTRVERLVADHLRIKDLQQMRPAKMQRFLLRPDAAEHLELHRADCLASHGSLDLYRWAAAQRAILLAHSPALPRLLTGDDLIAMGYRPGPRFATMLETIEDAQLEGTIRTREEAVALVQKEFPLTTDG